MIIEYAINKILQMDPELIKIMQPLQHKIVSIKCTQFPKITLYGLFDIDHLNILINRHDLQADTEISGDFSSFMQLLSAKEQIPLSSLGIKIYGDLATAQNLEIFIKKLDLDWQEYLAQITNDQFSEATSKILTKSIKIARQQANSLTMMMSDYLLYEKELIASSAMLEEFYVAIDKLRNAVDRLQARMEHYANN